MTVKVHCDSEPAPDVRRGRKPLRDRRLRDRQARFRAARDHGAGGLAAACTMAGVLGWLNPPTDTWTARDVSCTLAGCRSSSSARRRPSPGRCTSFAPTARHRPARLRPLPGPAARVDRAQPEPAAPGRREHRRGRPLARAHRSLGRAAARSSKHGYDGPIYATPATRDLCAVMLARRRGDPGVRRALPQQAGRARRRRTRPRRAALRGRGRHRGHRALRLASRTATRRRSRPGVRAHLPRRRARARQRHHRARRRGGGQEDGASSSPATSAATIARSSATPRCAEGADVLITESTYGDRLHDGIDKMDDDLAARRQPHLRARRQADHPVVRARARAGGRLRAQEAPAGRGRSRAIPVYVDSPLTVKITDIFKLHPECYDAETRALMRGPRLAVRLRRPPLRRGRRGLARRSTREHEPCDHHLGERDVRGGPHPPPPQGEHRGREEHGAHRRLPGAAHARAPARRAARAGEDLRRRARAPRRGGGAERLQRPRRPERSAQLRAARPGARAAARQIALVHGDPKAQRRCGSRSSTTARSG